MSASEGKEAGEEVERESGRRARPLPLTPLPPPPPPPLSPMDVDTPVTRVRPGGAGGRGSRAASPPARPPLPAPLPASLPPVPRRHRAGARVWHHWGRRRRSPRPRPRVAHRQARAPRGRRGAPRCARPPRPRVRDCGHAGGHTGRAGRGGARGGETRGEGGGWGERRVGARAGAPTPLPPSPQAATLLLKSGTPAFASRGQSLAKHAVAAVVEASAHGAPPRGAPGTGRLASLVHPFDTLIRLVGVSWCVSAMAAHSLKVG